MFRWPTNRAQFPVEIKLVEIVVEVVASHDCVSPDLHLDLDRKLREAVERGWSGHGYQKCVTNVDKFVWL